MDSFDVTIIGAGPGGYVAAIRAAQLGLDTALVEARPTLGGTCLNVGCIPSKALLESSAAYDRARRTLSHHGVRVSGVELDLEAMMARKREVVSKVVGGLDLLMKKNRIRVFRGRGVLTAPGQVTVQGIDDTEVLETRHVVLATGSEPVELPFLPFDGEHVVSSTEALSFSRVPEHLVVVGGGAVGLELGSVWRRLGAEVTVVEMLPRIVPFADRFASRILQKALTRQGLDIHVKSRVTGARLREPAEGLPVVLTVEDKRGRERELTADRVLVAVGRRPCADALGLGQMGVERDDAGHVVVDEAFRTSVEGVYAIGDLVGGPMLAHKAQEEGLAVAEILAGGASRVNHEAIPNVVYTAPELAMVGLTREQARERDIPIRSGRFWFGANARALTLDDSEGMVEILAHAETDRLLGVHIVGPHASDLVAEVVIAFEFEASAEDLARSIHAHPTLAEGIKEAALAVDDRAVHG